RGSSGASSAWARTPAPSSPSAPGPRTTSPPPFPRKPRRPLRSGAPRRSARSPSPRCAPPSSGSAPIGASAPTTKLSSGSAAPDRFSDTPTLNVPSGLPPGPMRNALTRAAAAPGRLVLFALVLIAGVLLAAVAAAVHAAPGLAPALLDGAHISVAVDWLTGFTGHADVG